MQDNERKDVTHEENNRANKTEYVRDEEQTEHHIPEALIPTKEKQAIKEGPIQRMEQFGTRPKSKNFNNRPYRYCGASNWTPLHHCPALEVHCNKCRKKGHYAKTRRQNFNSNRTVKRL